MINLADVAIQIEAKDHMNAKLRTELETERARVRVLRDSAETAIEYLEHVQLHTEDSHALHFVNMASDWIKTGLATTAPEAGEDGE